MIDRKDILKQIDECKSTETCAKCKHYGEGCEGFHEFFDKISEHLYPVKPVVISHKTYYDEICGNCRKKLDVQGDFCKWCGTMIDRGKEEK